MNKIKWAQSKFQLQALTYKWHIWGLIDAVVELLPHSSKVLFLPVWVFLHTRSPTDDIPWQKTWKIITWPTTMSKKMVSRRCGHMLQLCWLPAGETVEEGWARMGQMWKTNFMTCLKQISDGYDYSSTGCHYLCPWARFVFATTVQLNWPYMHALSAATRKSDVWK